MNGDRTTEAGARKPGGHAQSKSEPGTQTTVTPTAADTTGDLGPAPGGTYSVQELADVVNRWCGEEGVEPANGQVGETLTERNVRFYRTVGILDAPVAGGGRGFTEKHALQLMALRLLQAQGLPLRRIRELLFGRSLEDLRQIRKRGVEEAYRVRAPRSPSAPFPAVAPGSPASLGWAAGETWNVVPLNDDFAVVCRNSQQLSAEMLRRLKAILEE